MFSINIPERVLSNQTSKFVTLLDSLLVYKQRQMFEAVRVNNPVLLNNKRWLLRKLSELGFIFPESFPIIVLQQVLLNADILVKMRGSKIGTELFCSILTLGEVHLDDAYAHGRIQALIPNSIFNGFITEESGDTLYIIDDLELIKSKDVLNITISSSLFSKPYAKDIQEYVIKEIKNWVPFNLQEGVHFVFNNRNDIFYHSLLNSYFV